MIDYERQLSRLVASVSPWKGDGLDFSSGPEPMRNLVIFKEVEMRPTKEFPKGRYAAMVGDLIIFDYQRLPIKVSDDGSGITASPTSITTSFRAASGQIRASTTSSPRRTRN